MSNTVLMVEDRPAFSEALADLLEQEMPLASICLASDRDSALQALQKSAAESVLLDIHVPGACGFSLLNEILRTAPHARVAIVSGDDDEELAREAWRQGASGFIPKRLEPGTLVDACVQFVQTGFWFPQLATRRAASGSTIKKARLPPVRGPIKTRGSRPRHRPGSLPASVYS